MMIEDIWNSESIYKVSNMIGYY